jgi:ankyrin repeat protein
MERVSRELELHMKANFRVALVMGCLTLLTSYAGYVFAEAPHPAATAKPDAQGNAVDAQGRTALHLAAEAGDTHRMETLLAAGADVAARDGYGNSPLHLAAKAGRLAAVELLLKHGADPKAAAYNRYTPLHLAAWSGNAQIVQRLIDKGADIKAKDYDSRPPLNYASTKKVVEVLVKAGAEANAAYPPNPPLLDAAMHGFPEVVEALLDHGADIQATDYTHYSPLHLAAWSGNAQVVKILILRGADVHYRDDWDYTALQWAQHWGNTEIIDVLKDKMAKTPFKADLRHH